MRPLFVLLAALALAACKPEGPAAATDPLGLLGHEVEWQVSEIAGRPVPEGVTVTIASPEPGMIAGTSGCNRYAGPAEMRQGRLHLGALVGTRMACPPAQMEVEQAFHSTIGAATGLRLAGTVLEFTDDAGTPLIRARR